MVESLERRHGPWHRDAAASAAIGAAVGAEMRMALCKMPLLLAAPDDGIRYALLTLSGGGSVVLLLDDGRLLQADRKIAGRDGHWSHLADDPCSAFHWVRGARAMPCDDRATSNALAGTLPEAVESGVRHRRPVWRRAKAPRSGRNPARVLSAYLVESALAAAGFEGTAPEWGRGMYAANALALRLERLGFAGFECAARLLRDPALDRLSSASGVDDTYEWLLGLGAEPELVGTVASRRRQFCRGYPELAGALSINEAVRTANVAPDRQRALAAVADAVDGAGKLAPAVAALRGWEPWVEKALRGRLAADRRLGQGLFAEQDPTRNCDGLARTLGKLGPAWRIRHGDERIAVVLTRLANDLGAPASAISGMCLFPGGSPSPWKRAWRRMPDAFRDEIAAARPWHAAGHRAASNAMDAVSAFEHDVALPLAALAGEPREQPDRPLERWPGQRRPRLVDTALAGRTLDDVLRISSEWHARLALVARAKASSYGEGAEADLMSWSPLFAPFSAVRGRVEVRCLTVADDLAAHGTEMHHCVGTYALPCLEGRSHIVAFHRDGHAVSTAEIGDDGHGAYSVVQMRGRRNVEADPDAQRALDLIMDDLAARREPDGPRRGVGLALVPQETIAVGVALRNPALARRRAALKAGYDVRDGVVVDRVVQAWRFALPQRARAALDRLDTPEARLAAVHRELETERLKAVRKRGA
jgi:hypothetical protein